VRIGSRVTSRIAAQDTASAMNNAASGQAGADSTAAWSIGRRSPHEAGQAAVADDETSEQGRCTSSAAGEDAGQPQAEGGSRIEVSAGVTTP
jgi:hypothetical protein